MRPAGDLIRFVLGPDDVIWPDVDEKAEGRGVWITLSEEAVRQAAKKNVFAKSLKTAVKLPDDLAALTREHLTQRLLGALGMAKKAGQLVNGQTRVQAALKSGDAIALLTSHRCRRPTAANKMVGLLKALGIDAITPHLEVLEFTPFRFGTRNRKCDTCCPHQRGSCPFGPGAGAETSPLHRSERLDPRGRYAGYSRRSGPRELEICKIHG